MKKLFILMMFTASMSGICFAQTLTGFSQAQSNVVRALVKMTADSVRKETIAAIKNQAATQSVTDAAQDTKYNAIPVIDTNYLKIVAGKVVPVRSISGDSLIKADKIEKKAINDLLNTKAPLTVTDALSISITTLSVRITAAEGVSGLTTTQLKALSDKLEVMRLTIPNGLIFPVK